MRKKFTIGIFPSSPFKHSDTWLASGILHNRRLDVSGLSCLLWKLKHSEEIIPGVLERKEKRGDFQSGVRFPEMAKEGEGQRVLLRLGITHDSLTEAWGGDEIARTAIEGIQESCLWIQGPQLHLSFQHPEDGCWGWWPLLDPGNRHLSCSHGPRPEGPPC